MTWNVLAPDHINKVGLNEIEDIANLTIKNKNSKLKDSDIKKIDAVILGGPREIDSEFIDAAVNLKIVSKYGVGLDNVDVQAASSNGIIVCNAPGSNAVGVAEHTISLLLSVKKGLHMANDDVKNGIWDRTKYLEPELREDVLGLYGCGNISKKVAHYAQAFGINCITYDPYVSDYELPPGVERVDEKIDLFERSNIVSVHTPLNEETHNSVSFDEFNALSPDGILINTARGGIINESALIDALEKSNLQGVGLDVVSQEPLTVDNELLEYDNVLLTPHIGGATINSNEEKSKKSANNVRIAYEGGIPDSTVNVKELFSQYSTEDN